MQISTVEMTNRGTIYLLFQSGGYIYQVELEFNPETLCLTRSSRVRSIMLGKNDWVSNPPFLMMDWAGFLSHKRYWELYQQYQVNYWKK